LRKNWHQKLLKPHVIFGRNEYVTDATMEVLTIFRIVHIEVTDVEITDTLHKILLDAATARDDAVNHFMLG
jgi:hypothetical protein